MIMFSKISRSFLFCANGDFFKIPSKVIYASSYRQIHSTITACVKQSANNEGKQLAQPKNESIYDYMNDKHSSHRLELEKCLQELNNRQEPIEVPVVIDGKEYRTDEVRYQLVPFNHRKRLVKFYHATHKLIYQSIQATSDARKEWEQTPLETRLACMERAANLVSGKYRQQLNAATIMGQGKTIKQAEIDSACELADFLRFNVYYTRQLSLFSQPISTEFEKNSINFRGLDGFIAAISPFNFTAIGANLASAPTLFGNCVIWKPSDTAILSNYICLKIFQEAGFPNGVINFVPSEGLDFGRVITGSRRMAGINFTGSLATFQWLWNEVGLNIKHYETFPRLIGECGGKNYHFIHKSAHLDSAIVQTVRSAFEYSGQKCSACSRLYVPQSLWTDNIKDKLISILKEKITLGPANDLGTNAESSPFTSAVIDLNAFKRITNYINFGKSNEQEVKLLFGGSSDNSIGYFIEPTLFETNNPENRLIQEEIFGPVLTVYPYPDNEVNKTMELINNNKFALTGAIFAQDETFLEEAKRTLKMSAGNLYINDKSTGAIVGQQPFGGSKHSGTNDKAGGPHYLMRWCNQQTIKQTIKNQSVL